MKVIKELITYRQMLKTLVQSNLRTRYKGSVFGFLWTFINPLIMLLIYGVVFSNIMRIDMENYYLFIFIGILPWMYFLSSIQAGVASIVSNSNLVKKIYFPREVLPLSIVLGSLVNYLLSLIILFAALIILDVKIAITIAYFPLILLIQTVLTIGLTFFVSAINVYFRDLEHMLGLLLSALFYVTPIIYPVSMVPEKLRYLFILNPLNPIISSYQDIFYYHRSPNLVSLGFVSIAAVFALIIGWYVFRILNKRFAEEV